MIRNDPLIMFRKPANAVAIVKGSRKHPGIMGKVMFYNTNEGTIVRAEIKGLPVSSDVCSQHVFGFHIHVGESCTGNAENPFADADGHFNPNGCKHPYHAGDMPPLFGAAGKALLIFMTDRFHVRDIIGKTVIIHAHPDDFTTQPSGDAGEMIACGKINLFR